MNLAFLAKMGCRILMNPDALISCVLQAKYFFGKSFLEASLGHNPSFVWHSIHAAQSLVQKGAIIRVGSGSTIQVFLIPGYSILIRLFRRKCVLAVRISEYQAHGSRCMSMGSNEDE